MAAPTVFTVTESATTTAGTNHVISLPGAVADDLILICMDIGSTSATFNAHGSYTELLDEASANGLKVWCRKADGTESNPTLVSSASTRSASIALRIGGAIDPGTVQPSLGSTSSGTSTTPDPPASASNAFADADHLVVTFFGQAGEEANDDTWVNSPPTNYGPATPAQITAGTAGTNLGGLIGLAWRQMRIANGASENPGTFSVDVSAAWRAQTILVYPSYPDVPGILLPSPVGV